MVAQGRSWALVCLAVVLVGTALALQDGKKWTAVMIHCKDVGNRCDFLAKLGYCRLIPGHMSKLCMKSCNLCGKQQSYDGWNVHMKYSDNAV